MGPFYNIEKFSKKSYIRYTLYPEFVISSLCCAFVEGDFVALFTALKILQGTLYPVYATAYKGYKISHFVGLKKTSWERPKYEPR